MLKNVCTYFMDGPLNVDPTPSVVQVVCTRPLRVRIGHQILSAIIFEKFLIFFHHSRHEQLSKDHLSNVDLLLVGLQRNFTLAEFCFVNVQN